MVGCQKWWDVKKLNSEFLSSNNAMYWEQNGVPCKSPAMKFLKSSQVFICNKWETKYRIRILNLCGEFSGRRILRVEDAGKSNLHSSRPFAPHLWGGNLWMLPFEGGSRYQLGDRIFSCLGHSHLSKGEVSAWQRNGHFVTKRWMDMTRMKIAKTLATKTDEFSENHNADFWGHGVTSARFDTILLSNISSL